MSNQLDGIKVGDELCRLSYGIPDMHTVVAVGRKWVTLDNGMRIDKQTMQFDGYGGRCFRDLESAKEQLWVDLIESMSKRSEHSGKYVYLKHVTVDTIDAVKDLLRLPC